MTKRLIKTAIITLISMMAVACEKSIEKEAPIKLPDIIQAYDRTPFGRDHFHAFKRAVAPIWEQVEADYSAIELSEFGVPANITENEISKHLQQSLGEGWIIDATLNQQSHWGWSIGFRNRQKILVFVTINKQLVTVPPTFPMIPAGIITNTQIEAQKVISISQ